MAHTLIHFFIIVFIIVAPFRASCLTTPRRRKKENVVCLRNPCLTRGTTKRLYRNTNRRHATQNTLRDTSYISSLCMKIWSFSRKAKYARLRTLPRLLLGFRSSSFQPCNVPRRIKGFALFSLSLESLGCLESLVPSEPTLNSN